MEPAISEIMDNGVKIFTGIIRDLNERKQPAEKLRRSQRMDAIGKLTRGVAHDFNNMLNIILGYSAILKKKLHGNLELSKFAAEIHNAGNRGAKLTRILLDFSRGTPHEECSSVNINELILESKDMIEKSLTAVIEVNYALAPDIWLTNIDKSDLVDAVLNLSINSQEMKIYSLSMMKRR